MNYRHLATLVFLSTLFAVSQDIQACWHNRHCNCHHYGGSSNTGNAPVNTFNNPVANNVSMQFVPATFFVPAIGGVSNGTQSQGIDRSFLSSLATLKEILGILDGLGVNIRGGGTAPTSLESKVSQLQIDVERNRADIAGVIKRQQDIANSINDELAKLKASIESGAGGAAAAPVSVSDNEKLILRLQELNGDVENLKNVIGAKKRVAARFAQVAPAGPEEIEIAKTNQESLKIDEAELVKLEAERTTLNAELKKLVE